MTGGVQLGPRRPRSGNKLAVGAVALTLLAGVGGLAWFKQDSFREMWSGTAASAAELPKPPEVAPTSSSTAPIGSELLARREALEAEEAKLALDQVAFIQSQQHLTQRSTELDRRATELERRLQELSTLEGQLNQERIRLERTQAEMQVAQEALTRGQEQLQQEREAFAQARSTGGSSSSGTASVNSCLPVQLEPIGYAQAKVIQCFDWMIRDGVISLSFEHLQDWTGVVFANEARVSGFSPELGRVHREYLDAMTVLIRFPFRYSQVRELGRISREIAGKDTARSTQWQVVARAWDSMESGYTQVNLLRLKNAFQQLYGLDQ